MASLKSLSIIAKVSKYIGITSLFYKLNKNKKRIIAYHNVIPDKFFDDTLHLSHSMKESSFRKQINIISKRFSVDLDINNLRSAMITFDDGYLNQGKVAGKILNEKNLNAYYFCAGILIEKRNMLTMDKIQYWFSYVPKGEYFLHTLDLKLKLDDSRSRKEAWDKLSKFININLSLEDVCRQLDNIYKFKDIRNLSDEYFELRFSAMDEKFIEEMKKHGHKFGPHSYFHERYSILSNEKIKDDIKKCEDMKSIFNTNVFCYPYGSFVDINELVQEEVKSIGYMKALAYSNNPISPGYNEYFIPRMNLPNTDDECLIDFILSGAKYFLNFKKLLPSFN